MAKKKKKHYTPAERAQLIERYKKGLSIERAAVDNL